MRPGYQPGLAAVQMKDSDQGNSLKVLGRATGMKELLSGLTRGQPRLKGGGRGLTQSTWITMKSSRISWLSAVLLVIEQDNEVGVRFLKRTPEVGNIVKGLSI